MRLELDLLIICLYVSWNFNSIKVRLERVAAKNVNSPVNNFNSIKVRLERLNPLWRYLGISGFQFHKGAIRTYICAQIQLLSVSFQFHKGAIRTFAGSFLQYLK